MNRLTVVVGGQYGSEGKGAITAHLARQMGPDDLNIRVGGPNAGHTVWDDSGVEWKLRQIPAAAPVSECRLAIAAGSEIDPEVLIDEIARLDRAGYQVSQRLSIHPAATIIEDQHKQAETDLVGRIGSTGKGIGAARAARIMRTASTALNHYGRWTGGLTGTRDGGAPMADLECQPDLSGAGCDAVIPWQFSIGGGHVLVEGTQGYGLGLHTGHYPHTTSSDCRAIDFLSMAGISPWHTLIDQIDIWVVARVYPIRVAGNSGPLDNERTWGQLGLAPEHTTVTGKVRRVGMWDGWKVRHAVRANGGTPAVKVAITMLDQMFPAVRGLTDWDQLTKICPDAQTWIGEAEKEIGTKIQLIGTSPTTVIDRR